MAKGYFDHPSPYSFGNTKRMENNLQRDKKLEKKETEEEVKEHAGN